MDETCTHSDDCCKHCPHNQRTFRGTVYLKGIGSLRMQNQSYSQEFTVKAMSRQEAIDKIAVEGLHFLRTHKLIDVTNFQEITP